MRIRKEYADAAYIDVDTDGSNLDLVTENLRLLVGGDLEAFALRVATTVHSITGTWPTAPTPEEQESRVLRVALLAFCEVMPRMAEGAEHLTCSEATAVADVLTACGHPDDARDFIAAHAFADYDEGDSHHELYLETKEDN